MGEKFIMRPGLNVDFKPAEMDGREEDGKIFCALGVRLEYSSAG